MLSIISGMVRLIAFVVVALCAHSSSLYGRALETNEKHDGSETIGLLVDHVSTVRNYTNPRADHEETTKAVIGDDFGALEMNSTSLEENETTMPTDPTEIEFVDNIGDAATNTTDSHTGEGFLGGCLSALGIIFTNEILDKTFIIAVVLAMHHSQLLVFLGAWSALVLMTCGGAAIGALAHLVPKWIITYASSALMTIFGLKMLYEAYGMTEQRGQEEYLEVEKEIEMREMAETDAEATNDDTATVPTTTIQPSAIRTYMNTFVKAFVLTFLAEWGDRSQVATVLLASTENAAGVLLGGVAGHAFCTGSAVLGGKAVAKLITIRKVTILGGIAFLFFAGFSVVLFNLNKNL